MAIALLAACSDRQNSGSETAADVSEATTKTAATEQAPNDGGVPLSAASKSGLSQYMQARRLADSGDFVKANQAARQLTEENPDFAGGWIMLSNTSLSGAQFVKAAKKAKEMSAGGTEGEQLWAAINMTFVTNETEEGLRLGKKFVDAYPNAARAWLVYSGLLGGNANTTRPAPRQPKPSSWPRTR